MLRITVVESSNIAVTLRVEGRITGPWVEELRTACRLHTSPDNVQLSLELADISFADGAGIALLRELRNRDNRDPQHRGSLIASGLSKAIDMPTTDQIAICATHSGRPSQYPFIIRMLEVISPHSAVSSASWTESRSHRIR